MPRLTGIPPLVRRLDSTYLRCYAVQHTWEDFPNDDWNPSSETLIDRPISWRCTSCGTVRRGVWKRNSGELLGGYQYLYPDGYQVGKQEWGNRTRKETFRAEYLERISG